MNLCIEQKHLCYVDAPSFWDDNQDSQSGDSNNTTTDKKDEYGTIL